MTMMSLIYYILLPMLSYRTVHALMQLYCQLGYLLSIRKKNIMLSSAMCLDAFRYQWVYIEYPFGNLFRAFFGLLLCVI